MSRPEPAPAPPPPALSVRVWPGGTRALAGALMAVAGLGVPLLLAAVVLATDPPVTPPILVRAMLLHVALPAAAAVAMRHRSRGTLDVGPDLIAIHTTGRRIEVPREAVVAVEPWRLPLPGPGLAVRLRSGRRLPWALEASDPDAVLAALGDAGEPARRHPTVRWAHARADRTGRAPWRAAIRYPLFALPFGLLFFNVHQHIAYGGLLGQWYLEGPAAWARDLLEHWGTVTLYCLLWGGCWRGVAEAIAWTVAAVAPARAARGRRAAEALDAAGYYGGVVALTAARFLA